MEYLLFAIEVLFGGYFLTNKLANMLKFGFLIYIFILFLSVIIFYLSFKLELSKLVVTILAFLIGIFPAKVSYLFNIIPFAILYFYVIDQLKENGIFRKKYYLSLIFIVFLGLIPIKMPGIFEKNFLEVLTLLLTSIFLMEPRNTTYPILPARENILKQIQNAFEMNAEPSMQFTGLVSLFALIISLVTLILLILLLVNITRIKVSSMNHKKERFSNFVLNSIILITASLLMASIFFAYSEIKTTLSLGRSNFWIAFAVFAPLAFIITSIRFYKYFIRFELYASRDSPFISKKAGILILLSFLLLLITNFVLYIFFGQKHLALLIILLSTLFISFLLYYTFSMKGEIAVYKNPLFRKSENIIANYERYGEGYLEKITDYKEFIIYLYFLSILKFSKNGIRMPDEMTPKEFLEMVKPYLKSNIFEVLTNAFYLVEYSKDEVEDVVVKFLKENANELLKEIKSLNNIILTLETPL